MPITGRRVQGRSASPAVREAQVTSTARCRPCPSARCHRRRPGTPECREGAGEEAPLGVVTPQPPGPSMDSEGSVWSPLLPFLAPETLCCSVRPVPRSIRKGGDVSVFPRRPSQTYLPGTAPSLVLTPVRPRPHFRTLRGPWATDGDDSAKSPSRAST